MSEAIDGQVLSREFKTVSFGLQDVPYTPYNRLLGVRNLIANNKGPLRNR